MTKIFDCADNNDRKIQAYECLYSLGTFLPISMKCVGVQLIQIPLVLSEIADSYLECLST